MAKVIDVIGEFKILQYSRKFVVINERGEYDNHAHFKKEKTCRILIDLIKKGIIPNSKYLRGAAKRICLDDKYLQKLHIKTVKTATGPSTTTKITE